MSDLLSIIFLVAGLALFEALTSIDNAIVNAQVLSKISPAGRRWFLSYGMLVSVFGVRGLLPWLIIFSSDPSLGPVGSLTGLLNPSTEIAASVSASKPMLFSAAAVFLAFLFFEWFITEGRLRGLEGLRRISGSKPRSYFIASTLVSIFALLERGSPMVFGAAAGAAAFLAIHAIKLRAEVIEVELLGSKGSEWSKLIYLEVIDAIFSIDGVVGAFAFTLSVPLILLGNGIGALAVRQLTVGNVEAVKARPYLEKGAMYSVLALSCMMFLGALGHEVPQWASPAATFALIGAAYLWSRS